MNKIILLLLFLFGFGFSQTDLFEITPKQGATRKLIKNATIYIVNTETSDSLLLSEYTGTKAGTYYRANTSFGTYKVYVNGSLVKSNQVFGATAEMIADSSITSAKIAGFKVADTTALKALTGKADGDVVYMEKISSGTSVGGGDFVYKSSGYTADKGAVFSASNGGYYVRQEFDADKSQVKLDWYGVSQSDSANYGKIQAAINTSIAYNSKLILSAGEYYYTQTPTITLEQNEGYVIEGAGSGRDNAHTILRPVGCNGLNLKVTNNGNSKFFSLSNLSILRDTSIAREYIGVNIDTVQQWTIKNITVEGFQYGIDMDFTGHCILENFNTSFNIIGIRQYNHSDGMLFLNGQSGQNDSIGISLNYGAGSVMVSTESSHQPIGVKADNATLLNVVGGRFENADSAAFLVQGVSLVNVTGASFLSGTATGGSGILAEVYDYDSNFTMKNNWLTNYENVDSTILLEHSGCSFWLDASYPRNGTAQPIKVYRKDIGKIYNPVTWNLVNSNSVPGTDADNLGKVYFKRRRTGIATEVDAMSMVQAMNDTTQWENIFTRYTDWEFTVNGGSVYYDLDFMRFQGGRVSFTTAAAAYTDVAVTYDTYTQYWMDVFSLNLPSATGMCSVVEVGKTSTTATYRVWHPSDTAGGLSGKIFFLTGHQVSSGDY